MKKILLSAAAATAVAASRLTRAGMTVRLPGGVVVTVRGFAPVVAVLGLTAYIVLHPAMPGADILAMGRGAVI